MIIKSAKDMTRYSGLKIEASYNLEKKCLILLEKNYECICGLKCNHFPVIKSFDDEAKIFTLSNNGYTLPDYRRKRYAKKIKRIIIKNKKNQIDCIIQNMKKSKVKHYDLHHNGKNVCINEQGVISIIDFDIAVINDNPLTKEIEWSHRWEGRGKNEWKKSKFKQSLNKNIYYERIKWKINDQLRKICGIL